MLRYFYREWLNGIRNQTKAFPSVLLMDIVIFRSKKYHESYVLKGIYGFYDVNSRSMSP